jgi:RNA polymerase sigma factor (sigma-70 family)
VANTAQTTEMQVAEYQPRIKSFIRKHVADKDDADDILQEVFYQLAKANSLMNPIEQVSAWLYRVAKNTIINWGKKRKEESFSFYQNEEDENMMEDFSEILFGDTPTASTPETEYLRLLVWEELAASLAELPAEQREVFEKTEMEGKSIKEISLETGVATNTLLSRKHYAVLHLRKNLKELYDDLMKDG